MLQNAANVCLVLSREFKQFAMWAPLSTEEEKGKEGFYLFIFIIFLINFFIRLNYSF